MMNPEGVEKEMNGAVPPATSMKEDGKKTQLRALPNGMVVTEEEAREIMGKVQGGETSLS